MALQWFIPMEAFVIFIFSEFFMTKLFTENREPNVIILSANTFSIKMLINEFTDIYILQIFLLGECSDLAQAFYKETVQGRGREREAERKMGRRRQHGLREFTVEEANVSSSATLQVACLPATGAHYLFFSL